LQHIHAAKQQASVALAALLFEFLLRRGLPQGDLFRCHLPLQA
jgi:hypothetical protein